MRPDRQLPSGLCFSLLAAVASHRSSELLPLVAGEPVRLSKIYRASELLPQSHYSKPAADPGPIDPGQAANWALREKKHPSTEEHALC